MRAIGGIIGGTIGILWSILCFVGGFLLLFATDVFVGLVERAGPFLSGVSALTLLTCLLVALPLLIFQGARQLSAVIFSISATIFTILIWVSSVVTLFHLWGKWPTLIGVILGPLVVLLTAIAALFRGEWGLLLSMAISIFWLFAFFGGSTWASTLYERRAEKDRLKAHNAQ
jgi:hypothetical protein